MLISDIKFKPVKAVIFDMDGTILDTEPLYTTAIQNIIDEVTEKSGKEKKFFTWEIKQNMMGLQRELGAKMLSETLDLDLTAEEYIEKLDEQVNLLMEKAQLLPDTEKIYQTVFADICKKYNKSFPHQTRVKVLGTTERRSCAITVEDCQLPITVDAFQEQYKALCLQRLGNADELPGANRLIRHLYQNNVLLALATSSGADSVAVKTKNHQNLFSLFHHKVMGSTDPDVKNGKPAPDIFLVAAKRFDEPVDPEDCLVFEDAPNGVTAARAAGMQVVMVPDDQIADDLRKDATLVLKSLEDFKPEYFGLPPFEKN